MFRSVNVWVQLKRRKIPGSGERCSLPEAKALGLGRAYTDGMNAAHNIQR